MYKGGDAFIYVYLGFRLSEYIKNRRKESMDIYFI